WLQIFCLYFLFLFSFLICLLLLSLSFTSSAAFPFILSTKYLLFTHLFIYYFVCFLFIYFIHLFIVYYLFICRIYYFLLLVFTVYYLPFMPLLLLPFIYQKQIQNNFIILIIFPLFTIIYLF